MSLQKQCLPGIKSLYTYEVMQIVTAYTGNPQIQNRQGGMAEKQTQGHITTKKPSLIHIMTWKEEVSSCKWHCTEYLTTLKDSPKPSRRQTTQI